METVIGGGPQSPAPRTKAAFAIAIAFAVVLLLYWVRTTLFVTFLGLCVAILVSRLADVGNRYLKLPRGLAATIATIVMFAFAAGLALLLAVPVIEQLGRLVEELPGYADSAQRWLDDLRMDHPEIARFIPKRQLEGGLGDLAGKASDIAWGAVTAVMGLFDGFVTLITIFFLALFFALEPERYVVGVARLWPGPNEPQVDLMTKIGAALRAWMVATGIDIAVVSVLWTFGLWLIGVDYFLLFGVIGGFCQIVPYYGPIAAFIPPLLIGFTMGTEAALAILVLYMIIQVLDSYMLYPFLLDSQVNLPPVTVLVAIMALGSAFGFWGILLAMPLLTVAYVVVNEVYLRGPAERVVVEPTFETLEGGAHAGA